MNYFSSLFSRGNSFGEQQEKSSNGKFWTIRSRKEVVVTDDTYIVILIMIMMIIIIIIFIYLFLILPMRRR